MNCRGFISAWGSRLTLALRLRQEPWNSARGFSRGKNGYPTESPTGAPEQVPEYGLSGFTPIIGSRRIRDETTTIRSPFSIPGDDFRRPSRAVSLIASGPTAEAVG